MKSSIEKTKLLAIDKMSEIFHQLFLKKKMKMENFVETK